MQNNKNIDVKIVEVGPRDGLQNEKIIISTEDKVNFVMGLIESGLKSIEVTSFVRPDKVPQMADAKVMYPKILKTLKAKNSELKKEIELIALVPNLKGLENAIEVNVKDIAIFTATSELFNKKNINASIDDSLHKLEGVTTALNGGPVKVRGYVSTVFGCPYEGENSFNADILLKVIDRLLKMQVKEISLGDTIGVAHPEQVYKVLSIVKKNFDPRMFALHFHDTRGRAVANVYQAYKMGFSTFDSSAGGIGGCPYAKGASGNVATEDLVDLFNKMGVNTGVDLDKVYKASSKILNLLNKESTSKIHQYLKRMN